jgi:hypothetical protein
MAVFAFRRELGFGRMITGAWKFKLYYQHIQPGVNS